MKPTVSVLMPVYNVASCIRKAIDSILVQTYAGFELVIVNDGSTDDTLTILQSYSDSRIRIINLPNNMGLVGALNCGLDQIQSDYIIRMDADEICHPQRFAKQIEFMEAHPEIGVSATGYKIIGGKEVKLAHTHKALQYQMINRSPFPHSGVIMRGSLFVDGLVRYDSNYEFAEDLELWMRLSTRTQFATIPEVLLQVTLNHGQLSRNLKHSARHNTKLRTAYLKNLFPQLQDQDALFLSQHLNRILPERIDKTIFSEFLRLLNFLSQTTKDDQLDIQLSEAVWFQLAHNAPHSIAWIGLLSPYKWITIPLWKYGWLWVKPIVKVFKG